MQRRPQSFLQPPRFRAYDSILGPNNVTEPPTASLPGISLALIRLDAFTVHPEQVGYEAHVRGEAAVAAALVFLLRECLPDDEIFVAAPFHVQREAVKEALMSIGTNDKDGDQVMSFHASSESPSPPNLLDKVRVDTVDKLQGQFPSFGAARVLIL
jgi:hypothetical protein